MIMVRAADRSQPRGTDSHTAERTLSSGADAAKFTFQSPGKWLQASIKTLRCAVLGDGNL
jgi:hypothetical protein